MNPLIALAIFVAYFAAGVLYALFVRYAGNRDAMKAANCSVAISLLMTLSVMQCLDNPWYLVPLLMGNWLGTYVAVHPHKFFWRTLMRGLLLKVCVVCGMALAGLPAMKVEARDWPVLRGTLRVVTAPVRAVRQVQLNSLKRRAARGNNLAAARTEGVASRKAARSHCH